MRLLRLLYDALMKKLAVARQVGGFMQSRSGIRPLRVSTLLDRERDTPDSHKELWVEKPPEQSEATTEFAQNLAGEEFGGEPDHPINPILSRIAKEGSELYHGSPRKVEVLKPRLEHGDPKVPEAVFGAPNRSFALTYAGRKWSDRDFRQTTQIKGGQHKVIMREMRPNALRDTFDGASGYLHTLPGKTFQKVPNRRSTWEKISTQPVRPEKIEKIRDTLKALKRDPNITLEPYDPSHPDTRKHVQFSIRRMKEMGDEGKGYLKWRLRGAPPEIKRMYREELQKTGKDSRYRERVERMYDEFYDKPNWMLGKSGAELKTKLLPHQQRVVERMEKQPGLVVAHGTGSGKTLSSIGAVVDLSPNKARVLVPAALKQNYQKEVAKHVKGKLPVEVESLQKAIVSGRPPRGDMLIVDEAHRLRNPKRKGYMLLNQGTAAKRMFLTASPVYNKPEDVAPLVNLAAGGKELPEGHKFEEQFVKQPSTGPLALINPFAAKQSRIVHKKELGRVLNKWVDYHGGQEEGFPSLHEKRIEVPMTRRQSQLHSHAWGRLPLLLRMRIKRGLPPEKQDLPKLNLFQSQVRQISSSDRKFTTGPAETSPKIQEAVNRLSRRAKRSKKHKALVYANFLGTLDEYGSELDRKKIPYSMFRGDMSKKKRDQSVQDLNAGNVQALLVSGAGGEGLDLKGVRQVQVLEPHWNEEKLRQVIGRARRYRSHDHLPPRSRNVTVERYASYPKGFWGRKQGIEEILYNTSAQKQRLNNQVLNLMTKQGEKKKPGADFYRAYFKWKQRQPRDLARDEWLMGPP